MLRFFQSKGRDFCFASDAIDPRFLKSPNRFEVHSRNGSGWDSTRRRGKRWRPLYVTADEPHDVASVVDSRFGHGILLKGLLVSPDGRNPLVRTFWIVRESSGCTRLITAYPLQGSG